MDYLKSTLTTGGGNAVPAIDPEHLAEVQEVVQELDKTVKIFRTYPKTNTIVVTAIDKLADAFLKYLETRENLELFVDRSEIQWRGVPVYEQDDHRRSLALKLDRDGVRRLVLQKGLTREEILSFLDAITTEVDEDSLEDDLVTLLWDKQLQHIKVYVLDDMSAGADEAFNEDLVNGDAPEDAPESGSSAGSAPAPARTSASRDEGNLDPSAQLALCSATMAKMQPVTDEQAVTLHDVAEREASNDVSEDLSDILFDILRTEVQDDIYVNALKVLAELVMMHVKSAKFAGAADLLAQMRAKAADETIAHNVRALIVEQLQAMGETTKIQAIIDAVSMDESVNLNDLSRFLKMLPTTAASELCALMEIEWCAEVAVDAVRHLVKDDPTVLFAKLGAEDATLAKTVFTIVEPVVTPGMVEVLDEPLRSADLAVQRASVQLLLRVKGPEACALLLHYVALEDVELRRTALAALSTFEAGSGSADVLRKQVAMKYFNERSLQERKTLLVTIARLEGETAVDFLADILNDKHWFEKDQQAESRACAALALGEIGNECARSVLEAHANERSNTIKTAVRLALKQADVPAGVGN